MKQYKTMMYRPRTLGSVCNQAALSSTQPDRTCWRPCIGFSRSKKVANEQWVYFYYLHHNSFTMFLQFYHNSLPYKIDTCSPSCDGRLSFRAPGSRESKGGEAARGTRFLCCSGVRAGCWLCACVHLIWFTLSLFFGITQIFKKFI